MSVKAQFKRYVAIGVVNTALDFGLYTYLTRTYEFWMDRYLLANAVVFLTIVTWSFFWNKYWTFKNNERTHLHQYSKFVFSTFVGITLAEGVLYLGVAHFELHDILAKVVAAPLVVVWNFLAYKLWAFRIKKCDKPHAEVQVDQQLSAEEEKGNLDNDTHDL